MLDVQRLKELHVLASPAPWEWGLGGWLYSRASCDQVIETRRINNGTDSIVEVSRGDKELIVEMRNALPDILTHIDTLAARVRALEECVGWSATEVLVLNDLIMHAKDFSAESGLAGDTSSAGCWATFAKALAEMKQARAALATTYPTSEEG